MLLRHGASKPTRFFTVKTRDQRINKFLKANCTLTPAQETLRDRLLGSYQIILDSDGGADADAAFVMRSFYDTRCMEVLAGDSLAPTMRVELQDIYDKVFGDAQEPLTEPRKRTIDRCYWLAALLPLDRGDSPDD